MILEIAKEADLRQLVKIIGDDRLSFGSADRLMAAARRDSRIRLAVRPHSRTLEAVQVIVDAELRGADRLIFHPTSTRRA